MSLSDWLSRGWLRRHEPDAEEVHRLLNAADRDVENSKLEGLSADWPLSIAHNAVVLKATAALTACGYEAGRGAHHYRVIQSLRHTIGAEPQLMEQLNTIRAKRNQVNYDRAGIVSDHEAEEAVKIAQNLRRQIERWLKRHHPEFASANR